MFVSVAWCSQNFISVHFKSSFLFLSKYKEPWLSPIPSPAVWPWAICFSMGPSLMHFGVWSFSVPNREFYFLEHREASSSGKLTHEAPTYMRLGYKLHATSLNCNERLAWIGSCPPRIKWLRNTHEQAILVPVELLVLWVRAGLQRQPDHPPLPLSYLQYMRYSPWINHLTSQGLKTGSCWGDSTSMYFIGLLWGLNGPSGVKGLDQPWSEEASVSANVTILQVWRVWKSFLWPTQLTLLLIGAGFSWGLDEH